jgi:hypothetical protein
MDITIATWQHWVRNIRVRDIRRLGLINGAASAGAASAGAGAGTGAGAGGKMGLNDLATFPVRLHGTGSAGGECARYLCPPVYFAITPALQLNQC